MPDSACPTKWGKGVVRSFAIRQTLVHLDCTLFAPLEAGFQVTTVVSMDVFVCTQDIPKARPMYM